MRHGVFVDEQATAMTAPQQTDSGIQFVVGTAPIHLTSNPEAAVNVPIRCEKLTEAQTRLGYRKEDMETFTLCQSMFWNFEVFGVTPVIFVNVLDPKKHNKDILSTEVKVSDKQAVLQEKDMIRTTVVVKKEETTLEAWTDYILSYDEDGYLLITLLEGGDGEEATSLTVEGKQLDPEKVTYADIIGGYDSETGKESGLQLIRRVYPMFGITAATIIAPGYSHNPAVAAVMQSLCEEINGTFRAECILDVDSKTCTKYEDVKQYKDEAGFTDKHAYAIWPMVLKDGKILYGSANAAAVIQYSDIANGGIPSVSPSNQYARVDGAVLADGTEVYLDFEQAGTVNAAGVATYANIQGWKLWGNYTAAFPDMTDPKDKFLSNRRFFTWHGNRFIRNYLVKCDNPSNPKLIESIVDEENVTCNGYVSAGICAGACIEIDTEKNTADTLADGKLYFRQKLTPYPPAQEIINTLSYDPEALMNVLSGGDE